MVNDVLVRAQTDRATVSSRSWLCLQHVSATSATLISLPKPLISLMTSVKFTKCQNASLVESMCPAEGEDASGAQQYTACSALRGSTWLRCVPPSVARGRESRLGDGRQAVCRLACGCEAWPPMVRGRPAAGRALSGGVVLVREAHAVHAREHKHLEAQAEILRGRRHSNNSTVERSGVHQRFSDTKCCQGAVSQPAGHTFARSFDTKGSPSAAAA